MNGSSETHVSADILIVDDTPANLQLLGTMLRDRGHKVRPVTDGETALLAARRVVPDMILLDINMPNMDGYEVCARLKADPLLRNIPVIFISANTEAIDKVKAFSIGGVDYVTKPFQLDEVEARVETHLRIQRLSREINMFNDTLQIRIQDQIKEISDSQIATIIALAKLSESRDNDTGNHIFRIQRYCRALAERLAQSDGFRSLIDDLFIESISQASALHDIGKVGIPDSILLKAGNLTPPEFETMKSHAVLGAQTLEAVMKSYPQNAIVRTGVEVTRSHHERYDGTGYPDGLQGDAIPLSARIVAIPDQYDALRNKRPYKPAYDKTKAYMILTAGDGRSSPDHFDPRVLRAFMDIVGEFDEIFEEFRES
jgi:putative two-component system response regulator